jgi:hypothetical protein
MQGWPKKPEDNGPKKKTGTVIYPPQLTSKVHSR